MRRLNKEKQKLGDSPVPTILKTADNDDDDEDEKDSKKGTTPK
jgi:hypothetical protein